MRPLGERVVIRPDKAEEVSAGGIVLPEAAQEKPTSGTVIAVGSSIEPDGTRVPLPIDVGATVLFSKYGGVEVNHEGDDLLIVKEDDVFGVVTDG